MYELTIIEDSCIIMLMNLGGEDSLRGGSYELY